MLSIHKISSSNASGISKYYEQLGREDYYTQGGEPPGYWLGRGAERLGLSDQVQEGELLRAMQGEHPGAGQALARNAGDDHAPGWDATFSAPKSVSAVWAVADRDTQNAIQHAQAEAVKATINYLEREATFARYGAGGTQREPVSIHGGLIVAAYEHSTSRNADPQLHTHCIIANMTADGRGIDLDTRHKMVAGALYRAELASQLRELGFAIERDGDSFRVAGVPEKLTEYWSSRHNEVQQALAEKGLSSYVASKIAVLNTREAKSDINRSELFSKWQEQAREFSFGREQVAELKSHGPAPALDKPDPEKILSIATEKNSTLSRVQLLHRVAVEAQGAMNARTAETYLQTVTSSPEAVKLQAKDGSERWTTRSMQKLEQRMVERAEVMARDTRHSIPESVMVAGVQSRSLSTEQERAVAHITSHSGAVATVQGHAGTGKSLLLGAAREIWETTGYSVRGTTLSGKAAEGLEQSAGIKSQTIHSLLRDLEQERTSLSSKTIVVLDEAGMVGSRQMSSLVREVQNSGAKLVLVGDTRQLQAIDAGAAFRAIRERVGGAELVDVRRQQYLADKQMARAFRDGRAGDALKNLDDRGLLHVEKTAEQAQQKAVTNYVRDVVKEKATIILASTRREVRELNLVARAEFRQTGRLRGADTTVITAQGERAFAEGDRVIFLRNSQELAVKNGTTGVVLNINDRMLRVQLTDGSERLVNHVSGYHHIDHSYAVTVHKAQGLTVDRAHIVAGEITGREWSYVAASRAREETRIYATTEAISREMGHEIDKSDLSRDMSRSHEKDTTQDYRPTHDSDTAHSTDSRNTDRSRENSVSPARSGASLEKDVLSHER